MGKMDFVAYWAMRHMRIPVYLFYARDHWAELYLN